MVQLEVEAMVYGAKPASMYKEKSRQMPLSLGFERYRLSFDGVDDYLLVPDSASLDIDTSATGGISILFWLYIISWAQPSSNIPFQKGEYISGTGWISNYSMTIPGPDGLAGHPEGEATFMWANPDGTALDHWFDNYTFSPGEWLFVGLTFDRSYARLYINGELKQEISETTDMITNDKPLHMGCRYKDGTEDKFQNILLPWFCIYARALPGSEIRYNMLNYHNPVRDGLVAYWPMEEGIGDTVKDHSGNGNDGTLYGVSWQRSPQWELRSQVGL